jgi:hypothetical protein
LAGAGGKLAWVAREGWSEDRNETIGPARWQESSCNLIINIFSAIFELVGKRLPVHP